MSKPGLHAALRSSSLEQIISPATIFKGPSHVAVNPDGLHVHSTDGARVAWVNITLSADAFTEYHADSFRTGINLHQISRLLWRITHNPQIEISTVHEGTLNRVKICYNEVTYTLDSTDPDTIHRTISQPNDARTAQAVLPGDLLEVPLKASDLCAKRIAIGIESSQNVLYLTAEGDKESTRYANTDDVQIQSTNIGIVESIFELDYLLAFEKTIPADSPVTIELSDERSIRIHHPILDGHGEVEFTMRHSISPLPLDTPDTVAELLESHPVDTQQANATPSTGVISPEV